MTPGMYLSSVLDYSCDLHPHACTAMLYHTNIVEVPVKQVCVMSWAGMQYGKVLHERVGIFSQAEDKLHTGAMPHLQPMQC